MTKKRDFFLTFHIKKGPSIAFVEGPGLKLSYLALLIIAVVEYLLIKLTMGGLVRNDLLVLNVQLKLIEPDRVMCNSEV